MRLGRQNRSARWARPGRGRPVRLSAAALLTVAILAGCSSTHQLTPSGQPARSPSSSARITVDPPDGAANVVPNTVITVTVSGGTLRNVSVGTTGDPVAGTLGPGGTVWHSQGHLDVSQGYTVTASAVARDGRVTTLTSRFRTLTPRQTFQTEIFEGYHQTYGVGMPIELTFNRPIINRVAVEQALSLTTSKPVVGAWYWDGNEHLDFRPEAYWPAGTVVSFTGHLDGVEGAPGVYGFHTLTQTFYIGESLIVVASTASHFMNVYKGGRLAYHWPISTGRPGDDTPDGTYLTIEKGNPVDMIGPGYNIEVPYSVRITFSGDYLHDAYWSVGEQGFTNVSHGCVNMPPADAQIYYRMAVPGDPVTIVGSPIAGRWDNGWTEWFLSWPQILAGSALHQAVVAGPAGSSFVNPAAAPPVHAVPPLQTSAPDNSAAA
jgi:lipoprotein-anchoring transpeptidase ErfK/SrfK